MPVGSYPDFTPRDSLIAFASDWAQDGMACFCSLPFGPFIDAVHPLMTTLFETAPEPFQMDWLFDPLSRGSANVEATYMTWFDAATSSIGVLAHGTCSPICRNAQKKGMATMLRVMHSAIDAFFWQMGIPFPPYTRHANVTASALAPYQNEMVACQCDGIIASGNTWYNMLRPHVQTYVAGYVGSLASDRPARPAVVIFVSEVRPTGPQPLALWPTGPTSMDVRSPPPR